MLIFSPVMDKLLLVRSSTKDENILSYPQTMNTQFQAASLLSQRWVDGGGRERVVIIKFKAISVQLHLLTGTELGKMPIHRIFIRRKLWLF